MILALVASTIASASFYQAPPPPPPPKSVIITAPVSATGRRTMDRAISEANACRRAFVGQDYDPQPAIWKVADADTTLYLLGTIHRLPLGFEWRTPQLDRIIAEAGHLVTEMGVPTDPKAFGAAVETMGPVASDGRRLSIADRLTGERRAKWLGMAAMMPDEAVAKLDRVPTWLAALAVDAAPQARRSPAMTSGVDDALTREFKRARKPVAAIEQFQPILASLAEIGEAQQLAMLNDAVDSVGTVRPLEQRMAMFHHWASGRPVEVKQNAEGSPMIAAVLERLLDRRNAAWIDQLKLRLKTPGTTLVAAGAGHFHGPNSVIDLLGKAGIAVERVSPTAPPRKRTALAATPKTWSECDRIMMRAMLPPPLRKVNETPR